MQSLLLNTRRQSMASGRLAHGNPRWHYWTEGFWHRPEWGLPHKQASAPKAAGYPRLKATDIHRGPEIRAFHQGIGAGCLSSWCQRSPGRVGRRASICSLFTTWVIRLLPVQQQLPDQGGAPPRSWQRSSVLRSLGVEGRYWP